MMKNILVIYLTFMITFVGLTTALTPSEAVTQTNKTNLYGMLELTNINPEVFITNAFMKDEIGIEGLMGSGHYSSELKETQTTNGVPLYLIDFLNREVPFPESIG